MVIKIWIPRLINAIIKRLDPLVGPLSCCTLQFFKVALAYAIIALTVVCPKQMSLSAAHQPHSLTDGTCNVDNLS